ncbi:MAG TPA: NAD(P)-binding domain-containing protein, partial [Gemmatimonadaceae bacterium]|nr:NAD(P)-binding domain-containing protein [Gemmatimonadaceae bacterium]
MQLGMIGLGKMGGNMTERLITRGHKVVVFDRNAENVSRYAEKGADGASGAADLVARLASPNLGGEQLRLLPGGEVAAPVDVVVVRE